MKKRISAVVTALLVCLLLLPATVRTAYAKDYDEIVSYDITVQPNTEDGSLLFVASFDWKALEELPYGQELKIGVPNGSIREEKALTDNIERLDFDNSYMYVYLTQKYKSGETFHFAYSWVQEYMYTLGSDGSVTYDYTPGWFDEARVDHMTLTWQDPAGLSGSASWDADDASCWTVENGVLVGADLPHGSQVHLTATYPSWPTELSWENSSENYPDDDWSDWGGADHYENDGAEIFAILRGGDGDRVHRGPQPGPLRRRLRHPLCVRQPPVVPRRTGRQAPPRQCGYAPQAQASGDPPQQRRLRRRQAWRRWFWRQRLRRRQPLCLRQQLRLCLCLRLCRRRTGRLQRQEPLRRRPAGW